MDEQLTNEIVAMIFAEPTWCQLAALISFPLHVIFDPIMKYWLPHEFLWLATWYCGAPLHHTCALACSHVVY